MRIAHPEDEMAVEEKITSLEITQKQSMPIRSTTNHPFSCKA
jgi:hypothetical protein